LTPDDPLLYRNYLPDEVWPQMQAAGIDSALVVEAANRTTEIPWLLELTAEYDWIAGVIGWMSEADQTVVPHPKLRGARIPALVSGEIPRLPKPISDYGLACDLLMTPESYPQALALVQSYSDISFVIEHFGGANPTLGGHSRWAEQIGPLAQEPNVTLKVAGYLTSANSRPLSVETLRGYIDESVRLFGADRLMYGSDWPICTREGMYQDTISILRAAMTHLRPDEQAQIIGGTARRIYRLSE
jgi:L-fuconolactonase